MEIPRFEIKCNESVGRITNIQVKRDEERVDLDFTGAVETVNVEPMRNNCEFLSTYDCESLGWVASVLDTINILYESPLSTSCEVKYGSGKGCKADIKDSKVAYFQKYIQP
ncbi:hypothetical protein B5X24_HaOG210325 [Helicoverpa armigera]|uniref:Uncharacterized protein n=1 Tax=Helicoverpa armigera TaxID=29058 RepID=A0A2W1BMP0_HELAM|nr:hypothetical protein B5X24_HaOG210325 [Helicoverpa armigera]